MNNSNNIKNKHNLLVAIYKCYSCGMKKNEIINIIDVYFDDSKNNISEVKNLK